VRGPATLLGAGDQDVLRYFILGVALLLDPAAVLLLLAATTRRWHVEMLQAAGGLRLRRGHPASSVWAVRPRAGRYMKLYIAGAE
jgi:hypothetical protein